LLLVGAVAGAVAQQSSQSRAQAIAAAFTKHKQVVKETHGVRREKYKDVQSKPTIRPNVSDYSGVYEIDDLSYVLNLQVGHDGTVRGSGTDGDRKSGTFELRNATIDGAVLTATKVYSDGTAATFEGAFLTRTDRDSPTNPSVTLFGLGVVLAAPVELGGNTYDKLFYRLKP